MNTSSTSPRPLNWLYNGVQAVIGRGGQIAWDKVGTFFTKGKFTVKLNGAVAKGASSLTVDALQYPVGKDTLLDFGDAADVTVTLTANKATGQTSLAVTALTGPIPNGTILDFGVNKQAKMTAAAALGATAITVEALDTALVSGDVATYQGGSLDAHVTADAAAGATTLTVSKLEFAIADNAEAIADYTGTADKKFIPSGTIMVRDSSDKLFPRHDVTGAETATEILVSDANQASHKDAKSGYGTYIEAQVYENLLPDADPSTGDIPSGYKTELVTNGGRFTFSDWNDSRATE